MIYQKRRKQLLSKLAKNALVIIATNQQQIRSKDLHYPFRPNSDFWYLTGFKEPMAVAVFCDDNYTIFLQDKDKLKEIWDGERLGVKKALSTLKADKSYSINELQQILPKLISENKKIYYDFKPTNIDEEILLLLKKSKYHSYTKYLHEMRLIKKPEEIKIMQKAADISIKAHKTAMLKTKANMFEFEIASIFDSEFKKNNCEHAYQPIVAGGKNACTLHYIKNNKSLKNNQLLLIDAGCEVEGYAADITRTFPINGKFNKAQKQIYQIVLKAQLAAIESVKVNESIINPHKIAVRIIKDGLKKLGILQDNNLAQFYMHGTCHWLGLDVHDVGEYKQKNKYRKFKTGMVTTVEPGIYISKNDKIDPMYWDIGIRIEDNVLVTKNGNQVLTSGLIKNIKDIEKLMNKNEYTTSN